MLGETYRTLLLLLVFVTAAVSCDRNDSPPEDSIRDIVAKKWSPKTEETKFCRYRDLQTLYPLHYWLYLTSAMCYSWTQEERLVLPRARLYVTAVTVDNITYQIPYTVINERNVLFDYTNDEDISTFIAPLFRNARFVEKWKECSQEAFHCCENYMNFENVHSTDEYPCPAIWDGWACFGQGRAGQTVFSTCPAHSYTPDEIVCIMDAEKYCLEDGTWNQTTNYVVCAAAAVYRRRHNFHVLVLYISIALSFPAVVIFYCFKNLRIFRVILHRNLLIMIITKNILTILSKTLVILDALRPMRDSNNVLNDSYAGCKILAFVENVSKNAVFTLMLIDAYYLHKSIVRVFNTDHNIYVMYALAVVCSLIPSVIWASLMASSGKEYCWMVDSDSWYQWITDGYKYLVLGLNLVLLIDIIRVLLMKRAKNSTRQSRSTLKAALFLIPLFGLPLLLTGQRSLVDTETCVAGDVYYYFTYCVEAAQGVVVALFFCYFNGEVHKEIMNRFRKLGAILEARYGIKIKSTQNRRRTTGFTNVRSNSECSQSYAGKANARTTIIPEQKVKEWLSKDRKEVTSQNDVTTA